MTLRTYGQICGLARALELVGERWSMLVVRDLLLGPKRFTDLMRGLPKMPASILSSRLNEMEAAGVVRRRVLPQLDAAVVYELTEYGSELDQVVLQLGSWGARSLKPGPQDLFTIDSAVLSLYATFRPEFALGVHVNFELHYDDDMVVHALVDDGALKAAEGPHSDADIIIRPQEASVMYGMLTGQVSATEALRSGSVHLEGSPDHLDLFTRLFHVGPAPVPEQGLAVH